MSVSVPNVDVGVGPIFITDLPCLIENEAWYYKAALGQPNNTILCFSALV